VGEEMGTGSYNYEQEFEEINFSSSRLRSRFIKTMVELMEQPGKSIWLSSGSRSEAKAVYGMLGNEKLKDQEILRCRKIPLCLEKRLQYRENPTAKCSKNGQAYFDVFYHCDKNTQYDLSCKNQPG